MNIISMGGFYAAFIKWISRCLLYFLNDFIGVRAGKVGTVWRPVAGNGGMREYFLFIFLLICYNTGKERGRWNAQTPDRNGLEGE